MYDYLKGQLASKQLNSYRGTYIVVYVNGIGYLVLTGTSTVEKLDDNTTHAEKPNCGYYN